MFSFAITAILNVENHVCHSFVGLASLSLNRGTPIGDFIVDCAMLRLIQNELV